MSDNEFSTQQYVLRSLNEDKYFSLDLEKLRNECLGVASSLATPRRSITDEEIATIEQHTRLQNQSQYWYNVRDGRLTASTLEKFKPHKPLSVSTCEVY